MPNQETNYDPANDTNTTHTTHTTVFEKFYDPANEEREGDCEKAADHVNGKRDLHIYNAHARNIKASGNVQGARA